MASVCFYFQVHQPYRLRRYSVFEREANYFDENANRGILHKICHKCYLPANAVMFELIDRFEGQFRVTYSLSGVLLDQLERYFPDVLDSFRRLAKTGCVEFLAETYHHTLAFLYSEVEFDAQVDAHQQIVQRHFGQTPRVFRNTELVYNNDVARWAAKRGYKAVLCEAADYLLGYRAPTAPYHPPGLPALKLLLKNYRLSDDIAFRFGNRAWSEWPLTAEKFASWINRVGATGRGAGQLVNLFMDYETFGEHQWAETGIFEFLRHLPARVLELPDNDFLTISEAADRYDSAGEYDVPYMISWADTERDLSAWLGNAMQSNALHEIYRMEPQIRQTADRALLEDWRRLQTSDHFYYMCTKYFADGDVHRYFNPYDSPYDSYINFMNVLDNMRHRLRKGRPTPEPEPKPTVPKDLASV